ncbi:MAG: ClpXP protease specificity-enhancing factor SspB [Pseudomonadota bacterium]
MAETPSGIDYGTMMHDAMRGLIARVLRRVGQEGLPGDHHFFISFDTTHPGVDIADWLRERYPDDMTIVIQHWYEALDVDEDGFAVTLNFGDSPERLTIPWTSLRTFVDPSVEFGLRFETRADDDGPEGDPPDGGEAVDVAPEEADDTPKGDAEVVSLDQFRR